MFCPFCGHQVNDDSAFCMNCGKNLKINQTAAPEAASAVDNSNVQPPQPEYTAPQTPPVQQPVYTIPQTPPVQQPGSQYTSDVHTRKGKSFWLG